MLRLLLLCTGFALVLMFFVALKSIASKRFRPKYGHLTSSAYDPEFFVAFGSEADVGDLDDDDEDLTVFDASRYKRLSTAGRAPLLS